MYVYYIHTVGLSALFDIDGGVHPMDLVACQHLQAVADARLGLA